MLAHHLPGPIGLYDPRFEHDACGVGFIADLAGQRKHEILVQGIQAVVNLSHRGAVAADAKSGDGAGVLTQIPLKLFLQQPGLRTYPLHSADDLAVGMFFLPQTDPSLDRCVTIIEEVLTHYEFDFLGWREVPLDTGVLGDKARQTMPTIRQVMVARGEDMTREDFERTLYLARKDLERNIAKRGIHDFYVCSFSNKTIVYKGLVVSPQLARFYLDLQDPDYETALCIFHQRYSTNTFPTWPLAQPFRYLGHNGEINTLDGNLNWLKAREPELEGGGWSKRQLKHLKPIIQAGGSDSCALDNMLEMLAAAGRDSLHAMMMLIPEAYQNMPQMDAALRGFYEYHACLCEPWDGPAAVIFSDGNVVAATLDRNGLRPARYVIVDEGERGTVIMGSEVGLIEVAPDKIIEKGRLGPGKMIAVDLRRQRFLTNDEIKRHYATQHPYAEWVAKQMQRVDSELLNANGWGLAEFRPMSTDYTDALVQRLTAFGYTLEDIERILEPMSSEGKEPVGSMGDDTPLAVFSQKPRPLYHYFKQRFAQVTNPPIDPLREKMVMSLRATLGPRHSVLDQTQSHAHLIKFNSPIITNAELEWVRSLADPAFQSVTLDATFAVSEGAEGLARAVARIGDEATQSAHENRSVLILSDRAVGPARAPIPMLLAVSAVHHHLIRHGMRMRCTLVAETGETREEHHYAALIGYGATCINPYLAFETVQTLALTGRLNGTDPAKALKNYRTAVESGIYKIMSKMGISTVSSYRGAQVFEAIGLSPELIDQHFPGTVSRIGGLGLTELATDVLAFHAMAYGQENVLTTGDEVDASDLKKHGVFARMKDFGLFRFRKGGEYHTYGPDVFKAIHKVAKSGKPEDFAKVSELVANRPPSALRDLLEFKLAETPVPLNEVEPAESLVKRFVVSGMSHGALSREAHECNAIAMNRLGAKSNSGEGGEARDRYRRRPDGDWGNSAVKQIASGRFGVTPEYIANCRELEIKMAQGSKPGEGGQLPGHKVTTEIAAIRHSTVGVTLISPPPHHDIYSIEDLAQLIYDLKQCNSRAKVAVKLVSEAGVGTVAAGVAKAYAEVVQISGHDGGTGASPLGSIKNAGTSWELGLAETQQTLVLNDLRQRILVRADGGMKSGRDLMVAALLGAEEFGFGTAAVVAASCVMARQCHLNTCPVGVATQDPTLRARFKGKPENVINYMLGVAQELRELLSQLGFRKLDEVIGRVDLLQPRAGRATKAERVLLDRILTDPDPGGSRPRKHLFERNDRPGEALDDLILQDAKEAIVEHSSIELEYEIRNTHRTVGAKVAGEIAYLHGDTGFQGEIELRLRGTAGQSFGAFCIEGLRLILTGDANDYVGKSMNGGLIVVRPPDGSRFEWHRNAIVGNTVMYGATGGKLFAAGQAGERFCVRNSGGEAVIEGLGDHGCEYMTGGCVVVLGETGRNFAAGMTGGVAFVYDQAGDFAQKCNQQLVDLFRVTDNEDALQLRNAVEEHAEWTFSRRAQSLLDQWDAELPKFWKVQPHPPAKTAAASAITATAKQKHAVTEVESEKPEVEVAAGA